MEDPNDYPDYPPEYTGFEPLKTQVERIVSYFRLVEHDHRALIEKMQKRRLPRGAEGLVAVPSPYAFARRMGADDPHFANCDLVRLSLHILREKRKVREHEGHGIQFQPHVYRIHKRTLEAYPRLRYEQPGEIWILPAQFGKRHAGKSVEEVRSGVSFKTNEFGIGLGLGASMLAANPQRMVRWEELDAIFPGDESMGKEGFTRAPYVYCRDGALIYGADDIREADSSYGCVTAFHWT